MQRAPGLLALPLAVLLLASPALAYEHRDVRGTTHVFVAGFTHEPPLAGAPNAFSIRVTDVSKDGPVEGLDRVLTVDVQKDGSTKTLSFRRVRGSPGAYEADFVPTRPGSYSFIVHGTVGNRAIEEAFESGEGRFGDVLSLDDVGFPPPPAASAVAAPKPEPSAEPSAAPSAPAPADHAALEASLERAVARADAAEETAHRSFVAALGALAAAALAAGAAALSTRRRAAR